MKSLLRTILWLFLLVFFTHLGKAQGTFPISNGTINECRGYFTDTDLGMTPGNYDHNENYVFHICVSGSDTISMSFSEFCTEAGLDVLTFYDGPDTLSPMIGVPFSGTNTMPPVIIARSGCMTIHFRTDASVSCSGWRAYFTVSRTQPQAPVIAPIPNQSCNANALTLTLDKPILCDSVSPANIQIVGGAGQLVTSATPVNCVNGYTTSVQIQTTPGFTANGTYNLIFRTYFVDECDSLWILNSYRNFVVSGCPINVRINSEDTVICEGDCAELEAEAWGSTSGNYIYNWSNGFNAAGPQTVCPLTTTVYYVTVSDDIGTPPGTASKTVVVIPRPIFPPVDSVCQTSPDVYLTANPAGGYWIGRGIVDTAQGRLRPNSAGGGWRWFRYYYSGCVDSTQKYIIPMDAGPARAVCPDAAAFNLTGQPAGGTWSGTGITDVNLGTFDPSVSGIGSFVITYTAPNGCPPDNTTINVDNISVPPDDTICTSQGRIPLLATPAGGSWSGLGTINASGWKFDPSLANVGVNMIIYNMVGCRDTVYMTVDSIWAGWDFATCPTQAAVPLYTGYPVGGYWTGAGVDSATGTFNPAFLGGAEQEVRAVYHSIGGCTDTIIIYDVYTNIIYDTLEPLCPNEQGYELDWENTRTYPGGGIWSGAGVVPVDFFDPAVADAGWHKLYYEVNGCRDSTVVHVFNNARLRDTVTCIAQAPFRVPNNNLVGGYWGGDGMVDIVNGVFSPQAAGLGVHTIGYMSAEECLFLATVTVDTIPVLSLSGLPNAYCYKDTDFVIVPNYPNGVWSGATTNGIFNPTQAGAGLSSVSYSMGAGACATSASVSIVVSQPLSVQTSFRDTVICSDGFIRISASGSGGNNLNYNYSWSHNLGNGTSVVVSPSATTTYTIILTDGCSEDATDTVRVRVQPPFSVQLETDAIKCYGERSFVHTLVNPAGSYTYSWNHDATETAANIVAEAGRFYKVTVTETVSGCEVEADTSAPSYGRIMADFITVPASECVNMLSPEVQLIDMSEGGESGFWLYGDGSMANYLSANALSHIYNDVGTYTITLMIENSGGCQATASKEVCVVYATRIVAPTAFSPNGDGINDVFRLRTLAVADFQLSIYNRWGEKVFFTSNQDDGWDGTFKDKRCPLDVYMFVVNYRNLERNKMEVYSGNLTLVR